MRGSSAAMSSSCARIEAPSGAVSVSAPSERQPPRRAVREPSRRAAGSARPCAVRAGRDTSSLSGSPEAASGRSASGGSGSRGLRISFAGAKFSAAVKPLIERQDVAARPEQRVGVPQCEPLHLARHARREVGHIQMPVQDRADLRGRMKPDSEPAAREARIAGRDRLGGDEALAEIVRHLDEIGPARAVVTRDRVERGRAVAVERRVEPSRHPDRRRTKTYSASGASNPFASPLARIASYSARWDAVVKIVTSPSGASTRAVVSTYSPMPPPPNGARLRETSAIWKLKRAPGGPEPSRTAAAS